MVIPGEGVNGADARAPACRVEIADELHDPAWDAFLAQTPGGHHTQTSLWAQVKASVGWRSTRSSPRGRRIVAGAQLLLRPLLLIGAVGYVPRGPVSVTDDPEAATLVMDGLLRLASARRVRYLSIQPPCNGQVLAEALPRRGFQRSAREVEPTATVVLDLNPSEDELLARMKMRTRYNVRLGVRKGIVVREGTEADIPAFHRLLQATGGRQHLFRAS